ncbi:MAG: helix-turn-helix domain-containing protein [Pirellulaceae bacterium]
MKPRPITLDKLVPALIQTIDSKLPTGPLVELCVRLSAKNLSVPDVHKVILLAAQNKNAAGEVDMQVVSLLAQQLFSGSGPTLPSIAKVVARKMQVRLVEMRGATRQANIVRARGLAILLSRKLTSSSLQKIGEFFGGRDHSTVIHACRKTEKLLDSDSELANLMQEVQAEVLQA